MIVYFVFVHNPSKTDISDDDRRVYYAPDVY